MKMRALLSLFAALALPAVADVLADPTRPPANWQPEPTQAGAQKPGAPQLTSILVSHSRRVAVIDGVSLSEGETANGLTVVHIDKSWVDARVRDTSIRLSLADANVMKERR
jgi:MSHA biogenesis protein MshK